MLTSGLEVARKQGHRLVDFKLDNFQQSVPSYPNRTMAKGAMDSSTFQALVDKVQQVMARDISRFYGKQSAVKITYTYFPYV